MLSYEKFLKIRNLSMAHEDAMLTKLQAKAGISLSVSYGAKLSNVYFDSALNPEDEEQVLSALKGMIKRRGEWQIDLLKSMRDLHLIENELITVGED